jgi:predicted nucleic acid-binding protein
VTYLVDTNAVSDLMVAAPEMRAGWPNWGRVIVLLFCTIVRGEVLFGIARLPIGKRRTRLEEASSQRFDALPCEPIPEGAGDFYAAIKLARQRRGATLDENDLWIAATALALGATLVSRDRDVEGIDGLQVISLDRPQSR